MSPRNWKFRLEDMMEAIVRIEEYVKEMDNSSWPRARKTIDAVIRNLEIIGKAANHLPDPVQEKYQEIPWLQIKGMRNLLIHEYFGVDVDVLWQTIKEDLPRLKSQIQTLISETQEGN